jgi:hypothetical protein
VLRITPDELRTVFEPGQHVEEIKKRLNHSGEQPNRSGGQGNDSSRVQDVLHCNVSGAFRAHHLPIDRECGYFFDLVSLGKKEIEYALIGVDEGEMGVLGLFWHNVTRNDGE